LEKLEECFGKALGAFFGGGADVVGEGVHKEGLAVVEDAVGEVEAEAAGLGEPELDGEEVIVSGRGSVMEVGFDDGEGEVLFVKLGAGGAKVTEEFAAGGFEEVEVTGVVDVVAEGAFGVGDAVGV